MKKISTILNSKWCLALRLFLYIGCTYVCPIIFLSIKFKLFESADSSIRLTGWGIMAIMILTIGLYKLIRWCINNFGYNYWLGVLNGLIGVVLWLALALVLIRSITKSFERIEFVLQWSILTCSIGAFLNPLPHMAHCNKLKLFKEAIKRE